MKRGFVIAAGLLLSIVALTSACSSSDSSSKTPASKPATTASGGTTPAASGKKLKVVTTVAPLTNIIKNVGGDRIDLEGIIPDGVDSHTFEPSPQNAILLSKADIFIMNGAHLEGSSEKIARENIKDSSKLYKLADNTYTGDDEKTGTITVSPEAKKADQFGQDAMKEFMKTKPKGKSVAPKEAPKDAPKE